MADSVEEASKRKDEKMAERAQARERRRRLLPLFEELLVMSEHEFIELMLSAAEQKAGICYEGSEDMSAWSNLDLTGPLEGVWSDLKDRFEFGIEAGTSRHERVSDVFTEFKVNGKKVGPKWTYGHLEKLICAQIKQHPDDVDEDAAADERKRNEEAAAQATEGRKRKADDDTSTSAKKPRK